MSVGMICQIDNPLTPARLDLDDTLAFQKLQVHTAKYYAVLHFSLILVPNTMTKNQQAQYDKTCQSILQKFGSTNAIAIRSVQITDGIITGETVRLWFRDRKVPPEFVFVLYEMMDEEIDPLSLLPWLRRWVVMK